MNNFQLLEAVRRKYSSISKSLEQTLLELEDPEDVDTLAHDLDKCPTVHHLASLVAWLEGRQAGRIQGMRQAIYTLLNGRTDDVADQIEEETFHTFDPAVLEALLFRAANLARESVLSRN
jgi:hypothetical protein